MTRSVADYTLFGDPTAGSNFWTAEPLSASAQESWKRLVPQDALTVGHFIGPIAARAFHASVQIVYGAYEKLRETLAPVPDTVSAAIGAVTLQAEFSPPPVHDTTYIPRHAASST